MIEFKGIAFHTGGPLALRLACTGPTRHTAEIQNHFNEMGADRLQQRSAAIIEFELEPLLRANLHTVFEHAAQLGLEGIVSKRGDLPYRPGRGDHWQKAKTVLSQEFVILGYIPSTASKGAVGALLLGYYADGSLLYAGRLGTG